jgi:hypothetical protein
LSLLIPQLPRSFNKGIASLLVAILLFPIAVFGQTKTARVKVALMDGQPVYHWTDFHSKLWNDVDRALIVRAFRDGGYILPKHYVTEEVNEFVEREFKGNRAKMFEELKHRRATLKNFREFIAEELMVAGMRRYITVHGKVGQAPIPEEQWLASLRKGARIQMIR